MTSWEFFVRFKTGTDGIHNRKALFFFLFFFSKPSMFDCGTCWKLNGCKIKKMSKHSNHTGIILNYVPMVSTFCFAKLPGCLVSLELSILYIKTVKHCETHTHTHTHPLTLARILNTKYTFSLICWMWWNCFFLALKLLHYSHGRQMCAGLNGFIIHTVTQRLHRNRNILLSFSAAAIQPVLHPAIWHLLQC